MNRYNDLFNAISSFKTAVDTLRSPSERAEFTKVDPSITMSAEPEPGFETMVDRSLEALATIEKLERLRVKIDTIDYGDEKFNPTVDQDFLEVRKTLDIAQIAFERALYV